MELAQARGEARKWCLFCIYGLLKMSNLVHLEYPCFIISSKVFKIFTILLPVKSSQLNIMENSSFFIAWLITLSLCLAITGIVIALLNKGLKMFFESLSPDKEVSAFFTRITLMVLFLGGMSGALAVHYNTGEQANWLTLIWDSAGLVKETLQQLFISLIILSITFFILIVLDKKVNK